MMQHVRDPHIGLVYDYSHMAVGGFGLEASLRQLMPYTVLVTLKDARGNAQHYEFLLPGDGNADYAAYCWLLRDLNYTGFLNVEVSAMIHNKPGYDPVATARVCYASLAPKFSPITLFP